MPRTAGETTAAADVSEAAQGERHGQKYEAKSVIRMKIPYKHLSFKTFESVKR